MMRAGIGPRRALDLARHPEDARRWLDQANLADVWRNIDDELPQEEEGAVDAWGAHVEEFVRMAAGHIRLGPSLPTWQKC